MQNLLKQKREIDDCPFLKLVLCIYVKWNSSSLKVVQLNLYQLMKYQIDQLIYRKFDDKNLIKTSYYLK